MYSQSLLLLDIMYSQSFLFFPLKFFSILIGHFPSCFEPRYESEAKGKVLSIKISFHSYANNNNFHMKSFALNLAFIMRFNATRKWPIYLEIC